MKKCLTAVCSAMLLSGCTTAKVADPIVPDVTTKQIQVAPNVVDCHGPFPMKCLLVKEDGEKDWQFFYNQIEGFNYEEGFAYTLDVEETHVANPPADGSSLKVKLIKIVNKTKSKPVKP